MNIRVGFGYDVHRLVEGRPLWLGGIKIDHHLGLLGHSDADVLIHAVCDALLGAANLRDIGFHFPDTGAEYENIDSKNLLARVAEQPKINPHVEAMKQCMAPLLHITTDDISIKATTNERMGFAGREEGIIAYATALIER